MKKRLIVSLVASLVYTTVYGLFLYSDGGAIAWLDLGLGALVFMVVFYAIRTWLDTARYNTQTHSKKTPPPKE
jgi:hypothetical protein